jgi:hypothetical protein
VRERHADVAGPLGGHGAFSASLRPTSLGGVVVVEPDRITRDSQCHWSLSLA